MKVMKHLIDFRDFVYDGKDFWISARAFNGLLKLDFDKNKASYVTGFKNTTQNVELHGSVINTEDKIYFIPSLESTLDIYDKRSGSITSVSIYPQDMAWHCLSAYLVENKIVFLPFQSKDIICYDIETGKLFTIHNWEEEKGLKFTAEGYFFCGCGTVRGERLYAVSQRNEGVMELNIKNMSIIWHRISDIPISFSTMTDDGDFLWMSANKEKAFVCWDIERNTTRKYGNFPDNYKFNIENGQPFCNLVDCGDRILAVPLRANMSLWVEKETGIINECKQLNQGEIIRNDSNDTEEYRLAKTINKDSILLVSCRDKAIIKYNWKQKSLERKFIDITVDIQTGILKTTIDNSNKPNISFTIENDMVSLAAFLDYVNLKSEKQDMVKATGTEENVQDIGIGNKIFSMIKESLAK